MATTVQNTTTKRGSFAIRMHFASYWFGAGVSAICWLGDLFISLYWSMQFIHDLFLYIYPTTDRVWNMTAWGIGALIALIVNSLGKYMMLRATNYFAIRHRINHDNSHGLYIEVNDEDMSLADQIRYMITRSTILCIAFDCVTNLIGISLLSHLFKYGFPSFWTGDLVRFYIGLGSFILIILFMQFYVMIGDTIVFNFYDMAIIEQTRAKNVEAKIAGQPGQQQQQKGSTVTQQTMFDDKGKK